MSAGRVVVDLRLPRDATSPREARRAVAAGFADHPRCGDILVCVSEAVTNAVLHAESALHLVVRARGEVVRIEVRDGDRAAPVVRNPGPTTPTGRGMLLLDRLTTRWGVDGHNDGKTVWFEIGVG